MADLPVEGKRLPVYCKGEAAVDDSPFPGAQEALETGERLGQELAEERGAEDLPQGPGSGRASRKPVEKGPLEGWRA